MSVLSSIDEITDFLMECNTMLNNIRHVCFLYRKFLCYFTIWKSLFTYICKLVCNNKRYIMFCKKMQPLIIHRLLMKNSPPLSTDSSFCNQSLNSGPFSHSILKPCKYHLRFLLAGSI